MPNGYRLPDPLPWAALAASLAAAEDSLARLDERLRGSPIQAGWIARTHFADSCASLWLDGEVVPLEDLVLHDAHRDIHAPTRALIQAQAVLRARRRIAAAAPGWALTPAGLDSLRGRAGEGDPDTEPAPRDTAPVMDHGLGAGDGIFGDGFLPEGVPEGLLADAFAAVEAAVGRSAPRLAGDTARPERDPLIYDLDWNEDERLADWGAVVGQTAVLPPVVAAALALDAWEQIAPLQHSPWLGRLLIPALLRGRGKTKAHLVCLAVGLRAVPRDRCWESELDLCRRIEARWLKITRQLTNRVASPRNNQPCQGWGRGFESLRPLQFSSRESERCEKAAGRRPFAFLAWTPCAGADCRPPVLKFGPRRYIFRSIGRFLRRLSWALLRTC